MLFSFGDRAAISSFINLVDTASERAEVDFGPWRRLVDAYNEADAKLTKIELLADRCEYYFNRTADDIAASMELLSESDMLVHNTYGRTESTVRGAGRARAEGVSDASSSLDQRARSTPIY